MKNNEFKRMLEIAGLPSDNISSNILKENQTKKRKPMSLKENKLREKVREMIINELSEMDYEPEDFEKASREIEYNISPESEEEFDLNDEISGNHNYTDDMENTSSNDDAYKKAFTSFMSGEEDWDGNDKDDYFFDINDEEELYETKKDNDKDKESETDEEVEDIDINFEDDMGGSEGDMDSVQSDLMNALKGAKAIGDEKLITQIGNTIKYFVNTQISGTEESLEENEEYSDDSTELYSKGETFHFDGDESMDVPEGEYTVIKVYHKDGEVNYDLEDSTGNTHSVTAEYIHGVGGYWGK
jgi:hypothetical protein